MSDHIDGGDSTERLRDLETANQILTSALRVISVWAACDGLVIIEKAANGALTRATQSKEPLEFVIGEEYIDKGIDIIITYAGRNPVDKSYIFVTEGGVPINVTKEYALYNIEEYVEKSNDSWYEEHDKIIDDLTNNGWQDIENAPKDGTYVLTYGRRQFRGGIATKECRFEVHCYGESSLSAGWDLFDYITGSVYTPTHFMPLPNPPSMGKTMIDLLNNEMKDLNEKAYDWTDQTVYERFEQCIRLLKIHGVLSDKSVDEAWSNLKVLQHRSVEEE